jgi:group II intron reverse transcriptase/maturase
VDGEDFADIESYGIERWLGSLAQSLREKTYQPDPIKRVYIPKPDGRQRPLGISTIRDRVCMKAAMLILEPVFEADLPSEQYAYRPRRNAQAAVDEVEELLHRGYTDVVDADLSDYFGSIPHADLMKSVARRVVDRHLLRLIKLWLECPVEESHGCGQKRRTTQAKDTRRGIPQGSPISPLLANLYMRRFVMGWKQRRLEHRLGSRIVTYADDLVICCRPGCAEEALSQTRSLMERLQLQVNEGKTRLCRVPEETFDFLGYSFGRLYSPKTGKPRIGHRPSKRSIRRAVAEVRTLTAHHTTWRGIEETVIRLNRLLRGWSNHFSVGTTSPAYQALMGWTLSVGMDVDESELEAP